MTSRERLLKTINGELTDRVPVSLFVQDHGRNLIEYIVNSQPLQSEIYSWWLGQSGFILKTSNGKIVVIDAYLSNSAQKVRNDLNRMIPVPILPEELVCDYFICTHNHLDHADPETINALKNKESIQFIGPRNVVKTFEKCGVANKNMHLLEAGEQIQFGELKLTGTFCIPNSEAVLDSIGVLIQTQNKTIFHSGDTAYHPFMGYLKKYNPDLSLLCINGKFGNMNYREAYQLSKEIDSRISVPCHFDMFLINQENPKLFEALFVQENMVEKCLIPEIGTIIKI